MHIKVMALKHVDLVLAELQPSSDFQEVLLDTDEIATAYAIEGWEEGDRASQRAYLSLKEEAKRAFGGQLFFRGYNKIVVDETYESVSERIQKLEEMGLSLDS